VAYIIYSHISSPQSFMEIMVRLGPKILLNSIMQNRLLLGGIHLYYICTYISVNPYYRGNC